MAMQEYKEGNRQEFLADCQKGKYNHVSAIYRSNESTKVRSSEYIFRIKPDFSLQITGPFDKELISTLPESIKYICHNGAGYDNIDVPACSRRG
jgi:D-3-phosphoglycerate dehydrogenase